MSIKLNCFLLFLCFFTSCIKTPSSSTTLRISFSSYPITVDPTKSADFISSSLICLLYEGLTRSGPQEIITPALAYKIDISPEGTIYTFHLRKAFWTDGTSVKSADFEQSWKQSIDPKTPSICSYLFFPIKNAKAYMQGKVDVSQVGIKSIDPYTLRIELEKPTPYFLSLTAFPSFLPIPSHIKNTNQQLNQKLISNGPFQIDKTQLNHEIILTKNKQFWNRNNISLNAIHVSILPDETTALQMFERDQLDFIGGPLSPLPTDSLENLQKRNLLKFIPMEASTFCTLNHQTFPFNNPSIRKAFYYAIDPELILQETSKIGQILAKSPLPPTLFKKNYDVTAPILIHTEEAKKSLKKGLQELKISKCELNNMTLYHKQGADNQRLAQILQKNWEEKLGIHVNIQQLDSKNHLNKLHQKNYQLAVASWICQFHDPISLLERFDSNKNSKNYPGWENKEYSLLLEKASQCLNLSERENILKEAEDLLSKDLAIIPLYHWTSPYLCHPRLEAIATTPTGGVLFDQFQMKN